MNHTPCGSGRSSPGKYEATFENNKGDHLPVHVHIDGEIAVTEEYAADGKLMLRSKSRLEGDSVVSTTELIRPDGTVFAIGTGKKTKAD